MTEFNFGRSRISDKGPCYIIAEIGSNHQGNIEVAKQMIEIAADCCVDAIKFQKRNNKKLYTKKCYDKAYENPDSWGATYGEHRERLEFGINEFRKLKEHTENNGLEFMATPFDFESVDLLENIGVTSYKMASGDVTNTPLLEYIAKLGKPMFVSTGASTLDEIRLAYDTILKHNKKLVLFHCVSSYPAEYDILNLRMIKTLKKEFPKAIIGYSGHDNGILAPVIAYMLGAMVVEKHFTLNHAWKGRDHKFSLEPTGLRKQVRDLRRVDLSLGDGKKTLHDYEMDSRKIMGKSLYARRNMSTKSIIRREDISIKTPGGAIPPYRLQELVGKRLLADMNEEDPFSGELVADE
ncbi:MAG: N-acetylneuraminate synthase family protein [Methanobacteriota archaeon]